MKKKGSFVAEEVRGERGGGVEVRAQSAEGRRPKRGCAIENGRRCLPRQMARTRDATEAIIGPKGQHVSAQTGIFTAQLAHICWVNIGTTGLQWLVEHAVDATSDPEVRGGKWKLAANTLLQIAGE